MDGKHKEEERESAAVQTVKKFREEAEKAEAALEKFQQENKLLKKQLDSVRIRSFLLQRILRVHNFLYYF